jgi:hypothetical protein
MDALLASGGYVDWTALWKIVVIGLLAGSGLTAVYSIGVVFVSWAEAAGRGDSSGRASRAHPLAWVGAVFCLCVVLAGVGYGIDTMLAK